MVNAESSRVEQDTTSTSFEHSKEMEWDPSPLPAHRVRWYWEKVELTGEIYDENGRASVPEVAQPSRLQRFCISDSSTLEAAYRAREEQLQAAWWNALAVHDRSRAHLDGNSPPPLLKGMSWKTTDCPGPPPVPVRGGVYEVDLQSRIMKPTYAPGAAHRTVRGTWFVEKKEGEWYPLGETLAEQLEGAYRGQIWHPSRGMVHEQAGSGIVAARLNLQGIGEADDGLHAIIFGPNEFWLCTDDLSVRLLNAIPFFRSKNSGDKPLRPPGGNRLRRGYLTPTKAEYETDIKMEQDEEWCAQTPITHLLFVVHGIGQALEQADVAADAAKFRRTANELVFARERSMQKKKEGQPPLNENIAEGRVEIVPVQWRKHLDFNGDTLIQRTMPTGIRSLRHLLTELTMDLMYYLNPGYSQRIVSALVEGLNGQYAKFLRRNPGFLGRGGKVSILAHSLGSVLCYDLLCHQNKNISAEEEEVLKGLVEQMGPGQVGSHAGLVTEIEKLQDQISILQKQLRILTLRESKHATKLNHLLGLHYGKLEFPVDCLFLLGSPLACFFILRGIQDTQTEGEFPLSEYELPLCRRVYNLYHPYDPVAFRLEPLLFLRLLGQQKPVMIPDHRGGRRIHIAAAAMTEDFSFRSRSMAAYVAKKTTEAVTWKTSKKGILDEMEAMSAVEALEPLFPPGSAGAKAWQLLLDGGHSPTFDSEGRLDFILQDNLLDNSYFSAISAHFAYWSNADCAMFVLRALGHAPSAVTDPLPVDGSPRSPTAQDPT
mmetsp:Transcript_127/g.965  ORF Transcript_127/g.965 Transcript_127/m.965 type:complete len:769 (+) Transcript_127:453-2759(+)